MSEPPVTEAEQDARPVRAARVTSVTAEAALVVVSRSARANPGGVPRSFMGESVTASSAARVSLERMTASGCATLTA